MKIQQHLENIKSLPKYRYSYIIAEIGINHNGDLNIAKELISNAKKCNFDAVKFQMHFASEESTYNEDFRIRCEIQWWSTPMSMDRDEVSAGWFDYYFTIGVNNAEDATKGVYVIGCTPRTFGSLVALRCARQGHDFSLTGQHHEPCVKSFDRDSDYSLKGNRDVQSVSNEVARHVFEQALTDEDTILCVSYQENGQRFCHDDLKNFFRDNCRNFLHFFRQICMS